MDKDPKFPLAVAVSALTGIKLTDGGDTVDVRFDAVDGRMIAVLIPRTVFADLQVEALETLTTADKSDDWS